MDRLACFDPFFRVPIWLLASSQRVAPRGAVPSPGSKLCVAVTQATKVDMYTGEILFWTITTRGDVAQVLQAFCWGKEANLPWLRHENDGLRGAHVAITSPLGLRLLQVRDSSPVCTPAGDLDCEATELSCTDNSTGGNISLGSSQCLDKLPTETSAGSQAPDRNGNNIETLLDLLPKPTDQHVGVRSWGDAQQQLKERATPGSMSEAAEAWLRLIWLDATYKHLQPVHAILTKHGRRLSDLRPLVAAVHARCKVHCPAQDQQQQQQHNMHLLQDLLPASQCQELQTLLALVEAAVVNLHPHPQWLKQQLMLLVTKKLQLSQMQVTGLRPAANPAPVPAETAADQSANSAEDTVVAGVTASVHQTAAAKAADREEQATSAVIAGRMKRPELADATGSVSKKQRNSLTCQTTLASQDLHDSLEAAGKQAWSGEPLPKQAVSVAEAPAERPGVGISQHQQVAGLAEQQVYRKQQLADCSSAAAASTATVAAPPSGANAGGSNGSPGALVKLPRLSYSGGARRAPVGSHITIKLAANDPLSAVNNATASALAAAAAAAGAEVNKQQLEAGSVRAMAAEAAASVCLTPGSSGKPQQQPADLAAKQEQQQPVTVTQQQQQSQSPAAANIGAGGEMLSKAAHEAHMPWQATGSTQQQQQKQMSGEFATGQLHGAAEQSAGVLAARITGGNAGWLSAANTADAGPTTALPASSGLCAGRQSAVPTHHGSIAAIKQDVKQEYDVVWGAAAAAAPLEVSKSVAGVAAAGSCDSKSMATNECVDGRHIVCTPATQALKSTAPAASGAAAGSSSKPPDAAVARESADTAVAAAAKPAAAGELHAVHAAIQSSATSASAESSAVKSPAAKCTSKPIPSSATTVGRLANTPAVAQEPQDQESGAASAAGRADSAPAAKRARIPIPKPPTEGHNEPAADRPAAAAGSHAPKHVRAAPPATSATASWRNPDLKTVEEEYLLTLFDDFQAVHQQLKDIQRPQLQHTSSGTSVQLHWYLHHVDERMKRQLRDDEHALTFLRKVPRVFRLQYPGLSGRAGDVLFGLQPGAEQWLREFLLQSVQSLLGKYKASLRQAILASHDSKASKQGYGIPLSVAGTLTKDEGYMPPNLYPYTKLYPTFKSFVEARLHDEFSIIEPYEGRQRELVLKQPPPPPAHHISRHIPRQLSSVSNSEHQQYKQQQQHHQQQQISAAPPSAGCHDPEDVAPMDGVSLQEQLSEDLEFCQLVAEYKANLRECILHTAAHQGHQGVALASAGNPHCRLGLMSGKLLEKCREQCGSFHNFVDQYLSNEFETVDPDAERPGFKVLTLCSNTSSSATFLQPASNTVPAAPGAELAVEPVAGPRFLQLLAEYKDRLIKHIVQGPNVDGCWGVELGKAGNPLGNFMTPELAEYKKQLGFTMRDFVMEFLRDDFELVQPKPHCQTYYMIALRHISRHQQQPWLAADDIAKAAGGANKAHASAESGSLADGEDQLLEQLISPHQSQQQQLASSLPQVSQEQLFAEHESELWLDPVPQNTWASALSRPVDSVLLDLHSGLSAGPTSPQPPPPPQTSAAAGSARHCAWSGASVFERLSSPRETVLCHSASWPNRGLLARRGSVATPDISLQLAEDLDLAIIALFLQHAKEQQQAAMIFLEEGEVPTTLQVAPVTGLSTEDQHLIDSLGSISMPCAVFTECLLQSSCVNTDDQRSLFSDWLGYLCDSGVLIQGSDAVDDAAAAAMAAEASMSIRLDVAAMLQRLLKHNQLQGLIPQIEQALVNHLSAKTNFQGHLGVPRLEVGTATNCLRADLPQLRPYLLLPGFLRELVRKSSLRLSFWYGPSIKPPSLKEKRLWFVEMRGQAAKDWGFKLLDCIRVSAEGACRYDDHCFFSHVRTY